MPTISELFGWYFGFILLHFLLLTHPHKYNNNLHSIILLQEYICVRTYIFWHTFM